MHVPVRVSSVIPQHDKHGVLTSEYVTFVGVGGAGHSARIELTLLPPDLGRFHDGEAVDVDFRRGKRMA